MNDRSRLIAVVHGKLTDRQKPTQSGSRRAENHCRKADSHLVQQLRSNEPLFALSHSAALKNQIRDRSHQSSPLKFEESCGASAGWFLKEPRHASRPMDEFHSTRCEVGKHKELARVLTPLKAASTTVVKVCRRVEQYFQWQTPALWLQRPSSFASHRGHLPGAQRRRALRPQSAPFGA